MSKFMWWDLLEIPTYNRMEALRVKMREKMTSRLMERGEKMVKKCSSLTRAQIGDIIAHMIVSEEETMRKMALVFLYAYKSGGRSAEGALAAWSCAEWDALHDMLSLDWNMQKVCRPKRIYFCSDAAIVEANHYNVC